jgi:uracil-DNA glycosylase
VSAADLPGVYVTNAVRCAPPGNRPTASEFRACWEFLREELALFSDEIVVLALGRDAHSACVRLEPGGRDRPTTNDQRPTAGNEASRWSLVVGRWSAAQPPPPFAHGAVHRWREGFLVDSYHPSRQNTQTGRLSWPMFQSVVSCAVALARDQGGFAGSGED